LNYWKHIVASVATGGGSYEVQAVQGCCNRQLPMRSLPVLPSPAVPIKAAVSSKAAAFPDMSATQLYVCALLLLLLLLAVQVTAAVNDITAMSELAATQLQLPLGCAAVVTNGRTVIDFDPAAGNGTSAPGMPRRLAGLETTLYCT
jgi:uncharacterized integral membrane protein